MRNVRQLRRDFEGHDTKEEVINCFRRNEDFLFRPQRHAKSSRNAKYAL